MKMIKGHFSDISNIAIVTLADKDGTYTGYSFVHPDDIKYKSSFLGCSLAEQRAYIQFFRKKIKRYKIMLKTIQNLKKDIMLNCSAPDKKIMKRLNLKLRDYSNKIQECADNIIKIQDNITETIQTKEKINELIKSRSKDNNKIN